jgi:GTP-binding protein
VVAVSKAELTGAGEVRARLERELGRPVLAISAVTGAGLADLVRAVVEQLQSLPREAEQTTNHTTHTNEDGGAVSSVPLEEGP